MNKLFKNGDKVRVVEGHAFFEVGSFLYVVDKGTSQSLRDRYMIDVAFTKNGKVIGNSHIAGNWFASRFELVKEESKPAHNFKVGDVVRVIKDGHGVAFEDTGKTTTVTSLENTLDSGSFTGRIMVSTHGFKCNWSGRDTTSVNPATLELVTFKGDVDFTKAVQTLEGTPVVVITTIGRDAKYPVLVYEGNAKILSKYSLDGKRKGGVMRRFLMNVPVKPSVQEKVEYHNIYKNTSGVLSSGGAHSSRKEADTFARNTHTRVGVNKIVKRFVEGQFDE